MMQIHRYDWKHKTSSTKTENIYSIDRHWKQIIKTLISCLNSLKTLRTCLRIISSSLAAARYTLTTTSVTRITFLFSGVWMIHTAADCSLWAQQHFLFRYSKYQPYGFWMQIKTWLNIKSDQFYLNSQKITVTFTSPLWASQPVRRHSTCFCSAW